MVPGGGAEGKAPSPQPSPLPPSPAQAAGPGPALPPGPGSLHPHPSPSFPPPLTEPEPAAMRRGFRPGAERKTREPPRTGTASTTPEEPPGGCGGVGGGAGGQRAELRTRGTPAQCAQAREAQGPSKAEVIVSVFPFQFGVFLVPVLVLGLLLVCPSSFAFFCSLDPLARRLLVPLGDFCFRSGFHGSFSLCHPRSDWRELVATLTDADLRAESSSVSCFIENRGTLVLVVVVGKILV